MIRRSRFFGMLFKHFGVSLRDVWEVQFHIADLKGEYAHTEQNNVTLDEKLLAGSMDDMMHFVAHELVHWLTRKREARHYFSDPEEVDAFEWSIAHELDRGMTVDQVVNLFGPLVERNSDHGQGHSRLVQMISNAKRLLV